MIKIKLTKKTVYFFAVLSMLLWGLSYVWVKIVFKYYQPLTMIFIRLFLSSIILLITTKVLQRNFNIKKKDLKYFMIMAFFEPLCYFLGESFGLKFVSSTVGAVLIATIPVFSPLILFFVYKEKISILNIFGLIISFFGVIILIFRRDFSFDATPIGVLLMFIAVMSALGYAIYIKKLSAKYSSLTLITAQNLIGAIYFFPLFMIFDFNNFILIKPNYELVFSMLNLTVFASTGAFLLYIVVVRELGITRANIFTNFIPVFTALVSYFWLDEQFSSVKIAGIIIVISGVFLSQTGKIKDLLKRK